MLRFLADENLNGAVVRGLVRRRPQLDLVRVQDQLPLGMSDLDLLAWAAREERVILTHDVSTLRRFAEDRVRAGLRLLGVFEVGEHLSIQPVIDDILVIDECSREREWEGQVRFLPLR